MVPEERSDLRARIARYLKAHHTMTVATSEPGTNRPHAAHVFYAVDDNLHLIFLSLPTSLHGRHIGEGAPVAVTVSEEYEEWRLIQGVQLWGSARPLKGAAKTRALAFYLRRFPFVGELLKNPLLAGRANEITVFVVEPVRAGLTDNTSGVFGRETLELMRE